MPRRAIPTSSKVSTVSLRIRQERLRQGIAQERLGVLAGLEESSASARMSRYESGIHEPPFEFVEAIAKVLGVSPAFFYCPDDKLAEMIRTYSDLPQSKRAALHKIVVEFAE